MIPVVHNVVKCSASNATIGVCIRYFYTVWQIANIPGNTCTSFCLHNLSVSCWCLLACIDIVLYSFTCYCVVCVRLWVLIVWLYVTGAAVVPDLQPEPRSDDGWP
jgi:hypothetical protein